MLNKDRVREAAYRCEEERNGNSLLSARHIGGGRSIQGEN